MWNRRELKAYAKDFLRRNYWKAFIVVLITGLLTGGGSSVSNSGNSQQLENDFYFGEQMELPGNIDNPSFVIDQVGRFVKSPFFIVGVGVFTLASIVIAIVLITLGFVAEVGQSRFFLDGFKGDVNISKLFSAFNSKEYLPVVKAQLLRSIYIFLWTLLFIIPGIIKSIEYRFVPYILAENSNLTPSEAISRSRELTRGHKMEIFVLGLSFFWWYLLGAITWGIGLFFINPYIEATYARLYNVLSKKDLDYEFVDFNKVI